MNDRRKDLQADQALGALGGDEVREFEQLLQGQGTSPSAAEKDRNALERAAAALDLAFTAARKPAAEALPTHLRSKILAAVAAAGPADAPAADAPAADPRFTLAPHAPGPEPIRRSWVQPAGWFAAAAAAGLALWLGAGSGELKAARDQSIAALEQATTQRDLANVTSKAASARAETLQTQLVGVRGELAQAREQLRSRETELLERTDQLMDERDTLAFSETALLGRIEQLEAELNGPDAASERSVLIDRDSLALDWQVLEDPLVADAGVSGDVVWNPAANAGYMRFAGLPANDPSEAQYQLWIFDSAINADTPIDGGVFDISGSGEVIVAIDPKIAVTDATMFAITLERPGGVVVSDRSRLLLLAQRG